jgi:hypothetical protein
MTDTQAKLLNLLRQSPKTWRELVPSFSDRVEMNRALIVLHRDGVITYDLLNGVYRVASTH